jgi:hypothetical protein
MKKKEILLFYDQKNEQPKGLIRRCQVMS